VTGSNPASFCPDMGSCSSFQLYFCSIVEWGPVRPSSPLHAVDDALVEGAHLLSGSVAEFKRRPQLRARGKPNSCCLGSTHVGLDGVKRQTSRIVAEH
jgi:hypothetical protein